MKKAILMFGAALVLMGCAHAGDPIKDGYVGTAVIVPAVKDAKGKVTVPEIYRLHLFSDGDYDHRDVWINVDERTYAACPVNVDFPQCKQGVEGIE